MGPDCKMSVYLANGMLVYLIGSIFYLVSTFVFNVGTPFKDSLTAEQQAIKKKSAKKRSLIFYGGIVLAIALIFITKPFKLCGEKQEL